MLKYEMPVLYDIIIDPFSTNPFPEPEADYIEMICKASKDPSCKKQKFSRYMEEYRREGIYCKRGKKLTPERKAYYEIIRQNKLDAYIRKNKQKINRLKRKLKL